MRQSSEISTTFASTATHQASRKRIEQSPSLDKKTIDGGWPTSSNQSMSNSKRLPPLPPSSSSHDEADLRTQSPSLVEKTVDDGGWSTCSDQSSPKPIKTAPKMRQSSESSNTFASSATHQPSRRRVEQSPSFIAWTTDSAQSIGTSKSLSPLPPSFPDDEAKSRTRWAGAERALKKLTDNLSLRNIRDKRTPSASAEADGVVNEIIPDPHSRNHGELSDEPMSTRASSRQLTPNGSKFHKELSPPSTSKTFKSSKSAEADNVHDFVVPDPRSRNYSDLTDESIGTRVNNRVEPPYQSTHKDSKSGNYSLSPKSTSKIHLSRCRTCGMDFESRNSLFKHLEDYQHAKDLSSRKPQDYKRPQTAALVRSKKSVDPHNTCLACYKTFDCSHSREPLFQHLEDTGHATNIRSGEREELRRWSMTDSVDPRNTCLACYKTFDCSYSREPLFQHLEDTGHATNIRSGEREEVYR